MAGKKSGGNRNDDRPNGKARKKNPKTNKPGKPGRINGRTIANIAKREAWLAKGGRSETIDCLISSCNHPKIAHWKTGKIHGWKDTPARV